MSLKFKEFLKFGFSEKATKFEKNLCCTFDKSVVFCAGNSVLVKKSMKILKKNVDKLYYTNFTSRFVELENPVNSQGQSSATTQRP